MIFWATSQVCELILRNLQTWAFEPALNRYLLFRKKPVHTNVVLYFFTES